MLHLCDGRNEWIINIEDISNIYTANDNDDYIICILSLTFKHRNKDIILKFSNELERDMVWTKISMYIRENYELFKIDWNRFKQSDDHF